MNVIKIDVTTPFYYKGSNERSGVKGEFIPMVINLNYIKTVSIDKQYVHGNTCDESYYDDFTVLTLEGNITYYTKSVSLNEIFEIMKSA